MSNRVDGAVDITNFPATQPVTGPLTDAELRAAPVPVSFGSAIALDSASLAALETLSIANFPSTQSVTGTFWQATQPVSGTFWQATQPVSGPLTDAQLRAAAVPVSLASAPTTPVTGTFWQGTQPVSGPVTDAQLRAAAVPVSLATAPTTPVTGPVTDGQLRATPVPISAVPASTDVRAREYGGAMTWASLKSAAPAANALQATTGALTAGDYDFNINFVVSDTVAVGKGLIVEHRNAADAATLQVLGGLSPNGGSGSIQLRRFAIATNERIRVIAGTAAGAASSMYVSAIGRRIAG